jgi:flagellar biosynthesis protein FliR
MSFQFSAAFAVAFFLALVRASTWVVFCTPFSSKAIPSVAKIGIALGLALVAAGTLVHEPLPTTDVQVITQVVIQALIGLLLGFVVSMFVSAVAAAGSLVDLFSGLNLPPSIDPLSLQQSPILGQFYNLIATALLFTTGAVFVIVDGFLRSFKAVGTTLPKGVSFGSVARVLTNDLTTFFAAAVEIAAPVIVVLFATQIVLALLAKAAPQMNVFVFGFPLQILVALAAVGAALVALPSDVTDLVGRSMTQLFGA